MDVKSILDLKGSDVLTIGPDATVDMAATVLRDNYIGALVVVGDDGRVAGILSERDIAVALPVHGAGLGDLRVGDIMTADVVSCTLSVTVQQVLDVMLTNGFRHLPVVDDNTLIGVISLRDIVGNWYGVLPGGGMTTDPVGPGLQ